MTSARSGNAEAPGRRPLGQIYNPNTWGGAIAIMLALLAVLWAVEVVNIVDDYHLDDYGLRPRRIGGLDGILTMPFLHAGVSHLLANSGPFVIIGWMALLGELRNFVSATAIIVVGGGALTWLVGPDATIVGASALVFGWMSYVLGRAYFARRIVWILVAVFALFFFSGLFTGLLPSVHSGANSRVAWQAHVCGFVAGLGAAWLLHPRKGASRLPRRKPAPPTAPPSTPPLA